MYRLKAAICALCLLTIAPAICASQSRPNDPSRRDGIRLKVQIRNTPLPATVRLRLFTGADSLSGVDRLVSVPYDETLLVEQLRLGVAPTDPEADVTVAVEGWRDGALHDDGSITGKEVLVQVRLGVLALTAFGGPVNLHVF